MARELREPSMLRELHIASTLYRELRRAQSLAVAVFEQGGVDGQEEFDFAGGTLAQAVDYYRHKDSALATELSSLGFLLTPDAVKGRVPLLIDDLLSDLNMDPAKRDEHPLIRNRVYERRARISDEVMEILNRGARMRRMK